MLIGQDAEELLQVEVHHRVVARREMSEQDLVLPLRHRSDLHAAPSETELLRQSIADHQSLRVLNRHGELNDTNSSLGTIATHRLIVHVEMAHRVKNDLLVVEDGPGPVAEEIRLLLLQDLEDDSTLLASIGHLSTKHGD
jgi:hypothetical protein